MTNETQSLEMDELIIHVRHSADTVHILWKGASELQDPEVNIGRFLRGLLPGWVGKSVVMDFSELEYVNSATLQPILQIIKEMSASGIQAKIIYSLLVEWQRISFRSIKAITAALPHISVVGN